MNCFRCGSELTLTVGKKIPRSEECPKCFSDLHCCRMCDFYSTQVAHECKEPSAERVKEKDKKNFCDFFILKNISNQQSSKDDQLAKAMALFKK